MVLARRALRDRFRQHPPRALVAQRRDARHRSRSRAVAHPGESARATPRTSPSHSSELPAGCAPRSMAASKPRSITAHRPQRRSSRSITGWCTRRCHRAWNARPTAFISWANGHHSTLSSTLSLASHSTRRPCSAPISATACGSAPRRRAAPASTMPLEPRPDAGAPWTVAATPPRPDATAPGTPPSRRRPDAIRRDARGARRPAGRFWRIAGVSRTAECCESQRFLEDHKQPDLLDAWDNSHRRVSAEQFGDTAGV